MSEYCPKCGGACPENDCQYKWFGGHRPEPTKDAVSRFNGLLDDYERVATERTSGDSYRSENVASKRANIRLQLELVLTEALSLVTELRSENERLRGIVQEVWEHLAPPDEDGEWWIMDEGQLDKDLGDKIAKLSQQDVQAEQAQEDK